MATLDHFRLLGRSAGFYPGGTSESWLGEFVRARRDSLVLATKVGGAKIE